MSLVIRKKDGETWRQAAERYATKYGLEGEVLDIFDSEVARGVDDGQAAWNACYEWDVLDVEDKEPRGLP